VNIVSLQILKAPAPCVAAAAAANNLPVLAPPGIRYITTSKPRTPFLSDRLSNQAICVVYDGSFTDVFARMPYGWMVHLCLTRRLGSQTSLFLSDVGDVMWDVMFMRRKGMRLCG
jgi:hypothetical protein